VTKVVETDVGKLGGPEKRLKFTADEVALPHRSALGIREHKVLGMGQGA